MLNKLLGFICKFLLWHLEIGGRRLEFTPNVVHDIAIGEVISWSESLLDGKICERLDLLSMNRS